MTTDELIFTGLAMTASAIRTVFLNLIVPAVALVITLATLHREGQLQRLERPALPPAPVVEPPKSNLTTLPVRELRLLARAAGHKALARSGRKAQLLEVLA